MNGSLFDHQEGLVLPAGSQHDWTPYPAVIQARSASRIFAIGDAHSDFKRLGRAMAAAGII